MPDLTIRVENAEAVPFAASPMVAFTLSIVNSDAGQFIHTVVLRSQIQIEATRRRYSPNEQARLGDLFGEPERWGQTLRNLLWTNASTIVPQFRGATSVDLQVPCTFDFNVAATKYFDGLGGGEIPLCLMFSGTVFYASGTGDLQAAPIPWTKEVRYRLPVRLWKEMMDAWYPNSAWLRLRRDAFDELHRFKMEQGIPTWEQALEILLTATKSEAARA